MSRRKGLMGRGRYELRLARYGYAIVATPFVIALLLKLAAWVHL